MNRTKSRRTATSVSYKEASDEKTDSDELIDVEPSDSHEPVEVESAETIEKVLAQRVGKKGGLYIKFTYDEFVKYNIFLIILSTKI